MRRLWIAPFLVYTRGDPAADPDVALVRSVLAAMPGGLLLHLWAELDVQARLACNTQRVLIVHRARR